MPIRSESAAAVNAAPAIEFYTLSEQLARRIADDILSERLPPGHRMKEVGLANRYRVSRSSIREALRLLETRGLVQIEPRRGARITQLSAEEVDDLYEIRARLLTLAAKRVALRGDRELLAHARALLARIVQHATDAHHARYFDAVYAMSHLFAENAGSERLARLIRSFSHQVARYTRLSLRTRERRRKSAQGWKRLLQAVEARDAERAEEAMRLLVAGSHEAVREILREAARREAA